MTNAACRRVLAVLCLSTCVLAGQAEADDQMLLMLSGDEQLVSIATGTPQPVSKAPSVATVITAADIRATGATTLSDVLESVPGMHVSRSGLLWAPLYSIRGIQTLFTPEVLIMINGIPLTNSYYGDRGRLMGDIPLEHIARIEVIRGPGSAVHGAEAVSGAINIITRTASDIAGTESGLRAGSYRTYDGWVQHGGKWGEVDVAAYLRLGTTEGSGGTVGADAQTALDRTFGTRASNAPGPVQNGYDSIDARLDLALDHWRLRLGHIDRPNHGTGTGVADALDPLTKGHGKYTNLDLTWHNPKLTENWALTAQASYYDTSEEEVDITLFPAGSAFPLALPGGASSTVGMVGRPEHWERQQRLSVSALYGGFEKHKLRAGAGYNLVDMYRVTETKNFTFVYIPGVGYVPQCINLACSIVEATQANGLAFLTPHERRSVFAYLQDEWTLAPDWHLTTGLRHDKYSDFGSTTNPRIALVWDTAYNLTSKLMFGRAFRAPSVVELYTVNNPQAIGNPDLKPESIRTTELAFAWQPTSNLRTGLNLFRYQMSDVIRFVANADPTTGSTAQNAGDQTGSGMELEFSWDASTALRLTGNHAFQRSIDKSTRQDAGLAPHHHTYLRTDWRYSANWMLSGQLNRVADRRRQAGDDRPKIPDYTTADLTLRSNSAGQGWEFAVSIRNLFNADVREPTAAAAALNLPGDIPMPRRNLYAEMRHRL